MFCCKTHYLYLPYNFSGFRLSEPPSGFSLNTILKPIVIDKPDLFFNGIAHAYFVNISITVNINL